jgi:hypothetical protein
MLALRTALGDTLLAIKKERARRYGLLARLRFRRFLSLYRKYDINQPRDEWGRWAETGAGRDVDATGSVTPTENDARTGDVEVDSITDKLLEKLASVLDAIGPGSGPLYGIKVHSAFEEAVLNSGIPNLELEGSWYQARSILQYAKEGSIRTDVVLRGYGDGSDVKAIWDLKTGDATLTTRRAAQIRAEVGVDQSVPVIQLSVRRGVRLKSEGQ